MSRLRGALIQTKVVPASGLEPFMPEYLFYVPHRTAVEKQLGSGGMPKQMRPHRFVQPGEATVTTKWSPDVGA